VTDHQQLAQLTRVGAVGLGALLVAAPRGGVGRLGQVDLGADRAQLLDDEPPPGRRLQRRLEPLANEPRQEPADLLAIGRRNARPADLAGLDIEPLGGDLRPVLIESHYDRHTGPPQAPPLVACAHHARLS